MSPFAEIGMSVGKEKVAGCIHCQAGLGILQGHFDDVNKPRVDYPWLNLTQLQCLVLLCRPEIAEVKP